MRADRGSMTIEAAVAIVVLVVPLFYLVGTVGRAQAGAYAASAAAREAGRAFTTADTAAEAPVRAHTAAGLVHRAHGFEDGEASISLSCPDGPCLEPGSAVLVESRVTVELPLIPDVVAGAVPSTITLEARHLEVVDTFREGT